MVKVVIIKRNDSRTQSLQQRYNKPTWKGTFLIFFFVFSFLGLKSGWRQMIFHFPPTQSPPPPALSLSLKTLRRTVLTSGRLFAGFSLGDRPLSLPASLSVRFSLSLLHISALIRSSLRQLLSLRSASSVVQRPLPVDFLPLSCSASCPALHRPALQLLLRKREHRICLRPATLKKLRSLV
jgi:hypothetical protein